MTTTLPEAALESAVRHAIAYRRGLDVALQRPLQGYAEALAAFQAPLPEQGEDALAVIEDLVRRATPGLQACSGPRFFGWVIGQSHPVGVAADWLASGWGQNAGNHAAAPAAAASEAVAAGWLLELLDLPRESSVGFVTGATVANFTCLAAARGEVLRRHGWDIDAQGVFGAPPLRVLIGADAHATVFAGLRMLGFGEAQLERIDTDQQGRMRPAALEAAFARQPRGPSITVLQAGQIITGDCDPFAPLIAIAHRHGSWVHVDGAFGLWARACPARRELTDGIEQADSWGTDGHKWLQLPYDSGFAIVRHPAAHARAMAATASYLPPLADAERDPSHLVPELSRRARGFAAWALIRHLGRQGIADMVERHCALARRAAERLVLEPGVERVHEVALNMVAVRFGVDLSDPESDAITLQTIRAAQQDGTCFVGGAQWRGREVMRLSVINFATDASDIDRSVDAILAAYRAQRVRR